MKTTEFAALTRHLLPNFPGFAAKGQLLFMRPIGHTLRGIFFDRATNPREFYVQIFLQPLFILDQQFTFNVGWRLGGGCATWNADDPRLFLKLCASLQVDALPLLSRVNSPLDTAVAAGSLKKSGDLYVKQAIAYAFARAGKPEQALKALTDLVQMLDNTPKYPWQQEMQRKATGLQSELRENPIAVEEYLKCCEAKTIKNLRLEEFC